MRHRENIDRIAEEIKDELRGGNLFGDPIDLEDLNSMIVATKYFYEMKALKEKWGWK